MSMVSTLRAQPVPHFHRQHIRAPSAPAFTKLAPTAAKPTATPGILRLNHATQQPQQRSQQSKRQSPKPKQNQQQQQATSTAPAKPSAESELSLKPSPEIAAVKRTSVGSPARGRHAQSKQMKDRPDTRSASVNGGRRSTRQPSPPLDASSQAEVSPRKLFDPFTDNQTKAPVRLSKPSGRLAKSRQANPQLPTPPSTSPSRPVSIPKSREPKQQRLANSAPVPSHMPTRKLKSGAKVVFPICDDMEDMDSDSEDSLSLPTTPTKSRVAVPLTAPLSGSYFPLTPSPSPKTRSRPQHKRVPSEGVFQMSGDESTKEPTFEDLKKVLADLTLKRATSGSISDTDQELEAAKSALAGFYANSKFQNSPGPEDLPPPAF